MNPLFSISHIASSRHSPATFKPIIVAQRCSSALPGDTFAYYRRPTMFIGTTGRHFRPLLLPNGTLWHYRATLTAIIVAQRYWPDIFTHFTNPSLTQKPRLFTTSLQARTSRRHISLLSSPNDVHRHSRATLTSIIVVLGHRPDIVISSFLLFASFSSFLSSNICSIELSMNFNARKNATYLQN